MAGLRENAISPKAKRKHCVGATVTPIASEKEQNWKIEKKNKSKNGCLDLNAFAPVPRTA
jgi:hypothetical protein